MLDDVLIVLAGEFGRTSKIFTFEGAKSKTTGRDTGVRFKLSSLPVEG
jgi:hypothetical protein